MPLKKDSDIKFIPVVERYDYDVDGDIIYAGYADRGATSSQNKWKIMRFTYDVNKNVILKEVGYGVWDDRLSVIYA